MTEKKEVKFSQRIYWVTNTIFHQVVTVTAAFITYVLVKHFEVSSRPFIHFFATTFAYIPLMAESFILFNETNTWSLHVGRTVKGWVHGAILTISLIGVSVGIGVEIYSKNQRPGPHHFHSNHAILGLVSWVLFFVLTLTGVLVLYSSYLRKLIRPVILKTIHLCLGLSCYAIGIGSLILGLETRSFKALLTYNEMVTTKILVCLIAIWSSLGSLLSFYNHIKNLVT